MKSLSQLSSWLNKCKILSRFMCRLTALEPVREPSHKYAHFMFIDARYTSQGKQGRVFMVRENIKIFTFVLRLPLFFFCVDERMINFLPHTAFSLSKYVNRRSRHRLRNTPGIIVRTGPPARRLCGGPLTASRALSLLRLPRGPPPRCARVG